MAKITWKAGTIMAPIPPALITSGDMKKHNVMTAAWTGIICSEPVLTYVSIRPSRYTHELISKHKEFVINLPTWKYAAAVDTVGVKSGRDMDKFALTGLTAIKSSKIKAPQIEECPVSLECKVIEVKSFGTHDMFLAEVLAVDVDEKYIDETGALDLEKAGLLAYAHGFYYTLGRQIGKFGFSVEKKKKTNTPKETILKADSKFGKARRTGKMIEEKTLAGGVEVVVKKARFKKPEKKPEKKSVGFKKVKADKFKQKENKKTSYEPYSFKKKSDGSFKKKTGAGRTLPHHA
jgi:flavin reductase (DIM6/NTAB) family NADH-FMN oxidoreductase RutF